VSVFETVLSVVLSSSFLAVVVDRLWTKRHEVESRRWHAKRDAYGEALSFLLKYQPSDIQVTERPDGYVDLHKNVATLNELTSAVAPALLVAPENLATAMYRFCLLALKLDEAIRDLLHRSQHDPQSLPLPKNRSPAEMSKFLDWANQKDLRIRLEEDRVRLLDAMRADLGFAPRDVARKARNWTGPAQNEPSVAIDATTSPETAGNEETQ
jgi:hypothetical protein